MNSNISSAYVAVVLMAALAAALLFHLSRILGPQRLLHAAYAAAALGLFYLLGATAFGWTFDATRRPALGLSRFFPSRGGHCGASAHDARRDWAALAFGADPARRRRLHVCAGLIPKAAGDGGAVPVFHIRGAHLAARPRSAGAGAVCWSQRSRAAAALHAKTPSRSRRSFACDRGASPSPFCSSRGRKRRMRRRSQTRRSSSSRKSSRPPRSARRRTARSPLRRRIRLRPMTSRRQGAKKASRLKPPRKWPAMRPSSPRRPRRRTLEFIRRARGTRLNPSPGGSMAQPANGARSPSAIPI